MFYWYSVFFVYIPAPPDIMRSLDLLQGPFSPGSEHSPGSDIGREEEGDSRSVLNPGDRAVQADVELLNPLSLPHKCWDYRTFCISAGSLWKGSVCTPHGVSGF